ncbi:transcriptional regulator, LysR family [Komagataeibacter xylinus E25]|nr:transcriptional regulator, LysR family [Komagataeibacter xylinus E25]
MRFTTLAQALAVIWFHSVRQAATALDRPVSSVADALEHFESRLATRLVYTAASTLYLTPAGEELRTVLPDFVRILSGIIALHGSGLPAGNNETVSVLYHAARFPLSLTFMERFVAVVEAGSIHHAANRQHVSQSNLSRQISQAEQQLGRKLLCRSRNGSMPTSAGEAFYHAVRPLLRQICLLTAHADQRFSHALRDIRLGTILPINYESNLTNHLAQLVADWQHACPHQNLLISSGTAEDLFRDLKSAKLDIILTDTMVSTDAFEKRDLFSSELVLAGSTRVVGPTASVPALLAAHPIAVPSLKSGLRQSIWKTLETVISFENIQPDFVEVDALPIMLRLILDHGYLCVLPHDALKNLTSRIGWLPLPCQPKVSMRLVWPKMPKARQAADRIATLLGYIPGRD